MEKPWLVGLLDEYLKSLKTLVCYVHNGVVLGDSQSERKPKCSDFQKIRSELRPQLCCSTLYSACTPICLHTLTEINSKHCRFANT